MQANADLQQNSIIFQTINSINKLSILILFKTTGNKRVISKISSKEF